MERKQHNQFVILNVVKDLLAMSFLLGSCLMVKMRVPLPEGNGTRYMFK